MNRPSAIEEEWREVVGWPPYRVSSLGRVMGHNGKILRPRRHSKNYQRIAARCNGRSKDLYIHRMVLEAFVGPPTKDAPEGDHINGDRSDNRLVNLRWLSIKQNRERRNNPLGEQSVHSKLTKAQVLEIRSAKMIDRHYAEKFGVSRRYVNDVRRGLTWAWM